MKQHIFLVFIFSLLLFSLTFGCSSSHTRKAHRNSKITGVTVDDQEATVEVREKLDENGNVIKRNFNHPYCFIEAGLADILSSVYYKSESVTGDKDEMVFREEELQYIIPPIISAFAMADASQDILVFSSPHRDVLPHARNYFSMFMTDNKLNIVFSAIRSKRSWLTDGRAIQMGTYYRDSNKYIFKDPLDIKRGFRWSLVPVKGQRLASGRKNWLIIDFKYYGDSDLFGRAGSDNSIEAGSSVRAIHRKVILNKNVMDEKKKKEQTLSE